MLASQVGDDVPLAKLLEEPSGAKGRAQQIALLKEQVKGLQRRLEAGAKGEGGGAIGSATVALGGAMSAYKSKGGRMVLD